MEIITKIISVKLLENNFIKEKDLDICRYGLEICLTLVSEICAILLVSVWVGNFYETILFFMGFLPLRMYAGGYHADTKIGCFGVLVLAYVLFSILLKSGLNKYFMSLTSVLSVICVYAIAPLRLKNKTLSKKERTGYKRISTAITMAECLIIILACAMGICINLTTALFLGLFTVLISLIAGEIKSYIKGR